MMDGMLSGLRELPGYAYTDETFARQERGTVFRRNWVHAAGGYDIPEPVFPDLPLDKRAAQDILVLYPNTLVEIVAGHVLFIRIEPDGPGRTREVMSGYFVDGAAVLSRSRFA